jgi:peptidoglycan/LPS O-acetylase OafA/YrhL
MPRVVAGAGLALFMTTMTLESAGVLNGFGVAARFFYGIPAALLVMGVTAAERSGRLPVPIWLQMLGEASYSIYLFQFVFIGTMWQAWLKIGLDHRVSHFLCFPVLVVAALIGGFVMARFVEQPLLRLARGQRQAPARLYRPRYS